MIVKSRVPIFALFALLLPGLQPRHAAAQTGTENITVGEPTCTSAAPCTLQLYRAIMKSSQTACPAPGAPAYVALAAALPGDNVGTFGTIWNFVDAQIDFGVTYCYYATATYLSGTEASPPSLVFQVAIPAQAPRPMAPAISGAYRPAPTAL